jgi:very-short-patch-repair endonuclease
MDRKPATGDRRISGIAERQHGVLTIAQLRAAGVSDDAVKGRVRSARLHRIHRGVYAVGHALLSHEGRWMAAVLALDGALSHRDAAALWKLLPPRSGPVEISVSGNGGREKRKGIRVHRSSTLGGQVTRHRGIPVTTPARTIADLRASARRQSSAISEQDLRRAIRQADVLGLSIDAVATPDRTRSELELLFLQLCRRHGLPKPEVNVWIDSLLVDFLWRARRLVVETDGYRYHRGRVAFEADRDRDLRLKALGYEVIRLSYRHVVEQPAQIASVLDGLLKSRSDRELHPS